MELSSAPLVGIALAIGSAAALAVGNLLQARGVRAMEAGAARGVDGSKAMNLVRNHIWLLGAVLLGAAVLLQMGSLAFAPLMVVQPIGVAALVFTALLTAIFAKRLPSRAVVWAIAVCVIGVAGFVTVAALVSTQQAITAGQLIDVLIVLAVVLLTTAIVWIFGRHRRTPPVTWVLLGGIYSAFVATLGKTVILRVQSALQGGGLKWDVENLLTIGCIIGIGIAGFLSIYFVQRAHAANRPEVVIAGLTVVDPAIAVVLGIGILGEASSAPLWAFFAFAAAGAVAIGGVFALSSAESRKE
ncbi:multidrug DMT transporter permease [Microbacterium sp. Root61]|uniref:multidrug DMT transporter permease n=1 Tax=Microbacterium sp. Root61 TaxID=1736570 RepID=UPI0012E3DE29|nr:multidrug DMT transporter permease [Microbacterium sp. Root61]